MYETVSRREWMEDHTFSEAEAEAMLQLVAQVRSVTAEHFGRAVQPLMCLFPPFPIVRAIEAIASARRRRLRIFEVGPGSGDLGAYVLNAGHEYASMDITQSLYLWQNRLFATVARGGTEWVLDEGANARCVHIPWWQYARYHVALPIKADIVVCDAAMGEMETFGLLYNLRIARALADASDCAAFMFQHIGEEHVHKRATVEQWLSQTGLQGQRIGGVSIFSLPGRLDGIFPRGASDLPPLGAKGARRLAPKSFLSFKDSELLESYAFFNFVGYGL
jgi:hypothetical protein